MPTMGKGDIETLIETLKTIWIFGYGSLLWNPDIQYLSKKKGYIRGYPGRVATLVEEDEGIVWGIAYEVEGLENIKEALGNLNIREKQLGGYELVVTNFYSKPENGQESQSSYKVVMYMATPENLLYNEQHDLQALAKQIVRANGSKGSNIEYVMKLADCVRKHIPEDKDAHLFELENCVKVELSRDFALQQEALPDDEVRENMVVSLIAV
ncbi:hypothetical protein KUTeg_010281 [Tegillarca granosa]|uniref:glutathione-specific gamma-glutamylcyclotransferase n=1 Tax=Tegillarca granosa TaxID=220873 RepID=A0ABQ9F6A1_TEGGR|nr:hypothetical protein KUTeg_010281 [Tegillarca granosa]